MSFRRIDDKPLTDGHGEVRAFSVVRNEARYLPGWLEAHFRLGVDRWFVVDNGSTDGTLELLLRTPSVHVYSTSESYGAADCGHAWIRRLFSRHGNTGWNLVLDADERLVLPEEGLSLHACILELERDGADALETVLVDVYGAGPIAERPPPGVELDDDWFFDHPAAWPRPLVRKSNWRGGVRNRLFGLESCVTKIPLFRGGRGFYPTAGTHTAPGATLGPHRGALLHFKLVDHFAERAEVEARRGEHWKGACEYVCYEKRIAEAPRLSAFQPKVSVPWSAKTFRATGLRRWRDDERVTVLLPVRDAARHLDEALASLATQTWRNFEVLAWDNGSTDESVAILRRWIPSRLPGRVVTGRPLPLAECLAAMVEEATTELCARFDADDVCEPRRFEEQVKALGGRPDVAVLGTQVRWIDANGKRVRGSTAFPTEPVEIVHALLSTNVLSHPTVLFRKHAVLAVGNYRPASPGETPHFEDYDLWLRVARRFQIANLPGTLLRYRIHPASVTTRAHAAGTERAAAARCFARNAGALAGLEESAATRWFLGQDRGAVATARRIAAHLDEWMPSHKHFLSFWFVRSALAATPRGCSALVLTMLLGMLWIRRFLFGFPLRFGSRSERSSTAPASSSGSASYALAPR